jgi:hypothetical protein
MSGIEKSADFPEVSPALSLMAASSTSSAFGSAHEAFIDTLTLLLNRLTISDDAKLSETKRVTVRGALFSPHTPGVKFSAEYRSGKLLRVRVMTMREEDEDKAAVPAEFGGTGLMAAGGAGATETDGDDEAKPKRRRKAAPEPETLVAILYRAAELARLNEDVYTADQIEALLKRL